MRYLVLSLITIIVGLVVFMVINPAKASLHDYQLELRPDYTIDVYDGARLVTTVPLDSTGKLTKILLDDNL